MQEQSKKSFKSDAKILRQWLDNNVPRAQYNKVKNRIVEECLIRPWTLNNWLYGYCRIPDAGKRDINKVTMEFSGVEIFTIAKPGEVSVGVCGNSPGEAI